MPQKEGNDNYPAYDPMIYLINHCRKRFRSLLFFYTGCTAINYNVKYLFPSGRLFNLACFLPALPLTINCSIMKLSLSVALIVICAAPAFSQNLPAGYDAVSKMQQQVWMDKKLAAANPDYSNINGTPYVFEDFQKGNFYFSNKTFITDKLINYNCYTDEVLFSDEKNIYSANSQDMDYFTIIPGNSGTVLLFKQVFLPSEKKRIFMQVLYKGESLLLKRYRKEFLKADLDQPYGSNRQMDEYNDYYEYYVSVTGKEPVMLKPRKSAVNEVFIDKSDIMEDFIKDENIDLKNESDLVRLVEYYDKI